MKPEHWIPRLDSHPSTFYSVDQLGRTFPPSACRVHKAWPQRMLPSCEHRDLDPPLNAWLVELLPPQIRAHGYTILFAKQGPVLVGSNHPYPVILTLDIHCLMHL